MFCCNKIFTTQNKQNQARKKQKPTVPDKKKQVWAKKNQAFNLLDKKSSYLRCKMILSIIS